MTPQDPDENTDDLLRACKALTEDITAAAQDRPDPRFTVTLPLLIGLSCLIGIVIAFNGNGDPAVRFRVIDTLTVIQLGTLAFQAVGLLRLTRWRRRMRTLDARYVDMEDRLLRAMSSITQHTHQRNS